MAGISLGVLTHAVVETLKISLPAVVHAQRGTLTPEICDEKLARWSAALLREAEIHLDVSGLEHLAEQSSPFIVVSNHQSQYDIPVLFQALPLRLRMAAKKELFAVPIWGRAMRAAGFVEVDRKDRKRANDALRTFGLSMRAERSSLVVAPEGTRSKTGELLPFKTGAFRLARSTHLPVLPVAIDGTLRVHRSGEFVVHRGQTVAVRIRSPLASDDYDSVEALRDAAHEAIMAGLVEGKDRGALHRSDQERCVIE